jgi:hypothetical protein
MSSYTYPFTMQVNEVGTEAELLSIARPSTCAARACKCCSYETANFSSGGNPLGSIKETCYFCVPSFKIRDASGKAVYLLHRPTCLGGMCVNCCPEGNPCFGKGFSNVPLLVFDASAQNADGTEAPHLGKILEEPKSLTIEFFTGSNVFDVHFPAAATVEQKAMLVGTAVFLNAVFFERKRNW